MASIRGFIRKALKNDPLTSALVKAEKDVPGSVGSAMTAITEENVSSNPFSAERSRWDIFAGGDKLSRDPEARATGRVVGSFFAGMYGAGALGAGSSASVASGVQAAQLAGGKEAENVVKRAAAEAAANVTPLPTEDQLARQAEAMRRQRIRQRASGSRDATILTGIPDASYRNPYVQRKTLLGQ